MQMFLRPHYPLHLLVTHPCFFLFHQVVRKPLKIIKNILQTNESFQNELNFPSFISLCIHSGPSREKIFKNFLHKRQYQCILIFSVNLFGYQ